jgi:hypothetical protein
MFQPHSLLWHYLWVGPCVLLAVLAVLSSRRGLRQLSPAFFSYLVFEAIQGLTLYAMDLSPWVSDNAYWRAAIAGAVIELFVKLAVIWELFSHLVAPRPSVGKTGRPTIMCVGVSLAVLAAWAASHAHIAKYAILSYFQILNQGIYMVEAGLLLFIFLFAAYHHLMWGKSDFGIALGLSISACVGLGVFATHANGAFLKARYLLDFVDGGTYHMCVLIWFYYLLGSNMRGKASVSPLEVNKSAQDAPTSPAHEIGDKRGLTRGLLRYLLRIPNVGGASAGFPVS